MVVVPRWSTLKCECHSAAKESIIKNTRAANLSEEKLKVVEEERKKVNYVWVQKIVEARIMFLCLSLVVRIDLCAALFAIL